MRRRYERIFRRCFLELILQLCISLSGNLELTLPFAELADAVFCEV